MRQSVPAAQNTGTCSVFFIVKRSRGGWGEVAGGSVELVPGDVGGGVKDLED